MKTIITVSFVLVAYLFSFSQRQAKIFYDKDWKVCLEEQASFYRLVNFSDKNNKPIGIVKDYYITGELQWEGFLLSIDSLDSHKDTRANGRVNYYYINGNKSATGKIIREQKKGKWIYFHENGNLSSEGNYFKNKYNGKWKIYSDEGVLYETHFYKNGLASGKFKYGITETQVYKKNEATGPYRYYHMVTGKLTKKGNKVKGRETGLWKFFHRDGELGAIGYYENGFKTGLWTYYYPNKQISARGVYEVNKKVGEWEYYYKNGVYLPPFRYHDNPDQTGEWQFW